MGWLDGPAARRSVQPLGEDPQPYVMSDVPYLQ